MKKYIQPVVIAVLAIALLFSLQQCSGYKKRGEANAAALSDSIKYFRNEFGQITASINTLELDKKQAQDLLYKKDAQLAVMAKEFAKVHSFTKYSTVTKYDTINVTYRDTVPCVFERSGVVKNDWYSFGYRATQKGFAVDSLAIPNTATVMTGIKRKWFLGKETLTTDIVNTNPHITVTGITAAEITLPEPWYKKWYVWLGVGLAGGLLAK